MFHFDFIHNYAELVKEFPDDFDQGLIDNAFQLAQDLHGKSQRKSGETWLQHCLNTAAYVLRIGLDENAVAAAILHDVIDQGLCNVDVLAAHTNDEVALLVDGLSKLKENSSRIEIGDINLGQFRHLMIKSADDIRILLIRIAEKLDGIQNTDSLSADLRAKVAYKAMNIYARLCEYISILPWQQKFEAKAFEILNPTEYKVISNAINQSETDHQELLEQLSQEIKTLAQNHGISRHDVSYRRKGIYSAYLKIKRKHLSEGQSLSASHIDQLNDLLGLRIITNTIEECYIVLGLIHANWKYNPEEFDDYIVTPRASGYKSIHTSIDYKSQQIDIQIRTQAMHDFNEFGPASHIAYKESTPTNSDYSWVRQMHNWQKQPQGKEKYRILAFAQSKFVFTPKGKVFQLDHNATVLDFAFQVHTDIGERYRGALVNGKMVAIDFAPQTGDVIEIITSKYPNVNRHWLDSAQMSYTRSRIKRALRSKL